jgi:phosphoenolpyruvate-protein kinase (PTS system EI component)
LLGGFIFSKLERSKNMFDLSNIKDYAANEISNAKIEKNRAEIAKTKSDLADVERELEQLKHKYTRATQSLSAQERKARTHRLIERGAILETVITDADILTNEQIKRALRAAFATKAAIDELAAIRAEVTSS